jgi:hypothetical protein
LVDRGRRKDKLHFKYRSVPRWDKNGSEIRKRKPVIEVTFRKYSDRKDRETNPEIRLLALIDSGADSSFLPLEVAKLLHLEIEKEGVQITTIAGQIEAFKAKAHLEIPLDSHFPLQVGMINVNIMPFEVGKNYQQFVILRRQDFFEKFEATINEPGQFVALRDLHKERTKPVRRFD